MIFPGVGSDPLSRSGSSHENSLFRCFAHGLKMCMSCALDIIVKLFSLSLFYELVIQLQVDRLLFMFDERILIFLKSDSFYLPSVKTPKMAANPLKKTEIRRYTTEVPAFRPFFQRYGWTLWIRRNGNEKFVGAVSDWKKIATDLLE